ncbi:hypothetical protein ACEZDB_05385 [Streptacidiphilus sp. N1-3]|uniref:Pectate lyase n=1 Tax=Streptacidiphilus alkalitolerans TaxID=3342712 RepID=A0ABV6WVL3_9ACTN
MRHYTNSKGAQGIADSGVVKATGQNKVIEFDVSVSRVTSRYNSKSGFTEWVAGGDLEVTNITVRR